MYEHRRTPMVASLSTILEVQYTQCRRNCSLLHKNGCIFTADSHH